MTPDDYLALPYHRIIEPDEDGFSAKVSELSGCFSQGDTYDECAEYLGRAMYAWFAACIQYGIEIPLPQE